MSHRVFLRISLSCTEKADMPNEQMCIYLAHLSGFNWSKMIAKLSGIRGMLRALVSVREEYYNSVCSESLAHGDSRKKTNFYSVFLVF